MSYDGIEQVVSTFCKLVTPKVTLKNALYARQKAAKSYRRFYRWETATSPAEVLLVHEETKIPVTGENELIAQFTILNKT